MKSMLPAIEVINIAKKFTIGQSQNKKTLREELTKILTKSFKNKQEEFWALRNINLSVPWGSSIGLIGSNGVGKSTLLRILGGITKPTLGKVIIRGSVGTLLEIGAGFHSDLTGRENIFLSGVTLGMKYSEIKEKFHQIVSFSGIKKFLDTPVKHYSSGMFVRLAFSIAIQRRPDILLIDEVFSVGDAEFQEKSLNKLQEIIKQKEMTVVAVSHNLAMIKKLCHHVYVLEKGKIDLLY